MIRLVSLNIERSKHLDLVIPFLREQSADVVCLQELMEYDVATIEAVCGPCFYTPQSGSRGDGRPGITGNGIFSRVTPSKHETRYYLGGPEHVIDVDTTDLITRHATKNNAVSFADIKKGDDVFRIATTHFTWTPDGEPDDLQREDMKNMLALLSRQDEFVLCGDFNAPRGGEIFAMLTEKYKDNIPPHYKTSIDVNLHRAGHLPSEKMDQKMVDGLFTTPAYSASDVELHSGVSDHMAITATIARQESA